MENHLGLGKNKTARKPTRQSISELMNLKSKIKHGVTDRKAQNIGGKAW
jgi:hypothetical protein